LSILLALRGQSGTCYYVEEAALREAFGSDYLEYSRVTKKLVPGVY